MKNRASFSVIMIAILLLIGIFTQTAGALTINIVPSENVGLDFPYWGGFVTIIDSDGNKLPAMLIDWTYEAVYKPDWYKDTEPWDVTTYTRNEILKGAPVLFPQETYSEIAIFFLNGLLGYDPGGPLEDSLWAAGFNEMVWDTAEKDGTGLFEFCKKPYGDGILLDVYDSIRADGLDPTFDYSEIFQVWSDSSDMKRELLVRIPTAVPEPASILLIGSGLVFLIALNIGRNN